MRLSNVLLRLGRINDTNHGFKHGTVTFGQFISNSAQKQFLQLRYALRRAVMMVTTDEQLVPGRDSDGFRFHGNFILLRALELHLTINELISGSILAEMFR